MSISTTFKSILTCLVLAGVAQANPLFYESFNYGSVGDGVDTASAGLWETERNKPDELELGAGLTFTGYTTAGNSLRNDQYVTLGEGAGNNWAYAGLDTPVPGFKNSAASGDPIYMSFMVNVDTQHSSNRGVHMGLFGGGTGDRGINFGLTYGDGTNNDDQLHPIVIIHGLRDEPSSNGTATVAATALDHGKTYFLVAKFEYSGSDNTVNASMSWYADGETIPTTESWMMVGAGDLGWPQSSSSEIYENVALTKGNNGARANMDEARVGLSYTDVLPAVIPEPATVAVLGLGSLIALRRRR